MKKTIPLLLLIAILTLTIVSAEDGCCINPNTVHCDVRDKGVCCEDDDTFYSAEGVFGPKNQAECNDTWFFNPNEDLAPGEAPVDIQTACLILPDDKSNYCSQGCCCGITYDLEQNAQIINESSYFVGCQGENEFWADSQVCNQITCLTYFLGLDYEEQCNLDAEYNECEHKDPEQKSLQCKPAVLGNTENSEESMCCGDIECGMKNASIVDNNPLTNISCISPGKFHLDNEFMRCDFGNWYDFNISLQREEICKEVETRVVPSFYSELATCNEGTGICEMTIEKDFGECNLSECKQAITKNDFSVCCKSSECAYYNGTETKCYSSGDNYTLELEDEANDVVFYCNMGTWDNQNRLKNHGEACDETSICEIGTACIDFDVIERPPLRDIENESFCCKTDECATLMGCSVKDLYLAYDYDLDNSYHQSWRDNEVTGEDFWCKIPLWTIQEPEPEPEKPPTSCGGGRSGASGGGCGAPSGTNSLTNRNAVGHGDPCIASRDNCDKQLNLTCMSSEIAGETTDDTTPDTSTTSVNNPFNYPLTGQPNSCLTEYFCYDSNGDLKQSKPLPGEQGQVFTEAPWRCCTKDKECASVTNCVETTAKRTITLDGGEETVYICESPKWQVFDESTVTPDDEPLACEHNKDCPEGQTCKKDICVDKSGLPVWAKWTLGILGVLGAIASFVFLTPLYLVTGIVVGIVAIGVALLGMFG